MLADRGVRLDEAADMLRRALELDPTNAAYLDSMGWIFYKQNNLTQAESYLRKAVDRDSHDPTMLSHLGDVLAKSGHADQAAVEWWEKSAGGMASRCSGRIRRRQSDGTGAKDFQREAPPRAAEVSRRREPALAR